MKKNFHEFEIEGSLKIYDMVYEAFLECNTLVDLSNNIPGIFFHDILKYDLLYISVYSNNKLLNDIINYLIFSIFFENIFA